MDRAYSGPVRFLDTNHGVGYNEDMKEKHDTPMNTITVAGITFNADQVKSAILIIDEREIVIGEKQPKEKDGVGFE